MLKIWICLISLLLSLGPSAEAYTTARPTDFIYKTGALSTKINLVFMQPYTKDIDANGVSLSVNIKGKKMLKSANLKSDTSQIFAFSLKDLLVTSQQKKYVQLTSANIIRNTEKNLFTWNIEGIVGNIPFKYETLFTKEEYSIIAVEEEIYAKPGGGGLLIQYAGIDQETSDLIFYLTNESSLPHFSVKKIRKSDIPGYFKFLDGIIQIRGTQKDGSETFMKYEWEKPPKSASQR